MPPKSTSSKPETKQNIYKRNSIIICCSLVIGIAAGVIISDSIYNTEQIKEAQTALTHFSSLLDEKRISKTVSAVNKLATHPLLISTITGEKKPDNTDALLILEHTKFFFNTSLVYLLNAKGDVVACTPYAGGTKTLTGNNYSFRPYFIDPVKTAKVSTYPALGVTTEKRGIYFSAPVNQEGQIVGVVVIKIGLAFIDQQLAKYPYPCALLTKDGIIFSSNQQDWLYKAAYPLSAAKKEELLASRQFAEKPLTALPVNLQTPGEKLFYENTMVIPASSSRNPWGFSYISLFPLASPPLLLTAQVSLIATLSVLLFLFTCFVFIDRRRLFHSLKTREKDYYSIINNLKATFYRVDNDDQFIQVSPSMAEWYQPADCKDMIGCEAGTIWRYPEKRKEYLQALAENDGKIVDFPCQLLKRDGSTADVVVNASYFFDDNGSKQGIEGLIHDVSEIFKLQHHLLLLDSAVQAASNSIVITNAEGVVLWINQAVTLLTGFSIDEAVGQKTNLLKSGYHDDSFYEEMWQTIKAGKNWFGELINKRKDGSTYYEEMSITPVFGEDGTISNYIAIKNDISNRKKQEDEKEQMLTRERLLNQRLAEEKMKRNENEKMKKKEVVPDLSGTHIVLITDNSFERLLISELLNRQNCSICCIQESSEVSRKMKHDTYMLILLDMPLSSAAPIMEEIRRQGNLRTCGRPVLLITADRLASNPPEAATINITDYIQKPIDPVELFFKITQHLPASSEKQTPDTATVPYQKKEMILDRTTGIKRVMGNAAMYEKLLRNFKLEFQNYIKEILVEFENNNMEAVTRMVHTLKGASGGIGGDTLQKACEKMERILVSEPNQEKLRPGFDTLATHLSDLINELTPTEEISQTASGKPNGSGEIFCALYEQFASAVQSGKLKQSQQLAEELDRYNWSETDFSEISSLQQLLDSYTFDQAADLLQKIQQKNTKA